MTSRSARIDSQSAVSKDSFLTSWKSFQSSRQTGEGLRKILSSFVEDPDIMNKAVVETFASDCWLSGVDIDDISVVVNFGV